MFARSVVKYACRPNTVLAGAYDLKVFFTVVDAGPEMVGAWDALAFVTAQRAGRRQDRCSGGGR